MPLRSMVRRRGLGPGQSLVVSVGLSCRAVFVPTRMAPLRALRRCTSVCVRALDKMTLSSFPMNPSLLCAHFRMIQGLCFSWKVKKRRFSSRHSCSSTPTCTSHPASCSFLIHKPLTFANGSVQPMTTRLMPVSMMRSAQGGVLP